MGHAYLGPKATAGLYQAIIALMPLLGFHQIAQLLLFRFQLLTQLTTFLSQPPVDLHSAALALARRTFDPRGFTLISADRSQPEFRRLRAQRGRSVSDRLLKVACLMMVNQVIFDPDYQTYELAA